ncbi:hypothetical protein MKW98_017495 [Papaver atlanticum]|uniref:RNA-binding S4 domain-containing protein n=1 Tax=Papaver atlanticum TaxID=357466 RepID=A0AAD4TFL5_9MAGN|nr:hypothetical protein MKW98_017495 [Papaver atlanticum]
MNRYRLLEESQNKLDYVLALTVENFLERHLQTLVFKSGMAKSIHHARVLIRQRHIRLVCGAISGKRGSYSNSINRQLLEKYTSIRTLVSKIAKALRDQYSTSNLKIEALIFTGFVMSSHSLSVFHLSLKVYS